MRSADLLLVAEYLAAAVATYPGRTTSRVHALAVAAALGVSDDNAAAVLRLCVDRGMLRVDEMSVYAPSSEP
jgi:hypothetical protein